MSVMYNIYQETFPGKPLWSTDQMPNLTRQVIIVTGWVDTGACARHGINSKLYRGNTGIGREKCKAQFGPVAAIFCTVLIGIFL